MQVREPEVEVNHSPFVFAEELLQLPQCLTSAAGMFANDLNLSLEITR